MNNIEFKLNDIVILKKGHACGANRWEIVRYGVDCKLKCTACGRIVMFERVDLKKRIKKIESNNITTNFDE